MAESEAQRHAKAYPEHDKLIRLSKPENMQPANEVIGEFLDFLESEHIDFGKWGTGGNPDRLYPTYVSKQDIIGEFLKIDPRKLEAEKAQMIREMQGITNTEKQENPDADH